MDEIAEFEAECMVNGWNVTHPVGCILPDLIIPGVTQGDIIIRFPIIGSAFLLFPSKK